MIPLSASMQQLYYVTRPFFTDNFNLNTDK